MFSVDKQSFLSMYPRECYELGEPQADGLSRLLERLAADPEISDLRWAAYMLATVRHECSDRWEPIEEFGKGHRREYGHPVAIIGPDGTEYSNAYYGRG